MNLESDYQAQACGADGEASGTTTHHGFQWSNDKYRNIHIVWRILSLGKRTFEVPVMWNLNIIGELGLQYYGIVVFVQFQFEPFKEKLVCVEVYKWIWTILGKLWNPISTGYN